MAFFVNPPRKGRKAVYRPTVYRSCHVVAEPKWAAMNPIVNPFYYHRQAIVDIQQCFKPGEYDPVTMEVYL